MVIGKTDELVEEQFSMANYILLNDRINKRILIQ